MHDADTDFFLHDNKSVMIFYVYVCSLHGLHFNKYVILLYLQTATMDSHLASDMNMEPYIDLVQTIKKDQDDDCCLVS